MVVLSNLGCVHNMLDNAGAAIDHFQASDSAEAERNIMHLNAYEIIMMCACWTSMRSVTQGCLAACTHSMSIQSCCCTAALICVAASLMRESFVAALRRPHGRRSAGRGEPVYLPASVAAAPSSQLLPGAPRIEISGMWRVSGCYVTALSFFRFPSSLSLAPSLSPLLVLSTHSFLQPSGAGTDEAVAHLRRQW